MSWKCLFRHKWEYSKVTLVHYIDYGPKNRREKEYKATVRMCERCCKKQRKSLNPNWSKWVEMNLTKSEKRDKKLKELGL